MEEAIDVVSLAVSSSPRAESVSSSVLSWLCWNVAAAWGFGRIDRGFNYLQLTREG